ncbi:MAG: nitroreductase family protein [Smithellaceae bacterium]|nr:nitroreductase family protein [Smithellaceae bacterium]
MLKKTVLIIAVLFCFVSVSIAADLTPVKLPAPVTKGGRPLMQCLNDRKTDRSFSTKKLSAQILSNLLWAACGINRPHSGKRTAPSALNWQEIDVYASMEEGLYLYNPKTHTLDPVVQSDLRKHTARLPQPSRSSIIGAPLQLIYVADYAKMRTGISDEDGKFYSATDTAFIGQNVYLYCASEGLSSIIRSFFDGNSLAKEMKLRNTQKIILVQAIGYPQ